MGDLSKKKVGVVVNRLVGMGHKEKAICLRLFKCFSELMSAMQPYAINLFLCLSVKVRKKSAFHIFPLKFSFPGSILLTSGSSMKVSI